MRKDREKPMFCPLDRKQFPELTRQLPQNELIIVTLEGPNGVGKTAIHRKTLDVVELVHDILAQKNERDTLLPPVVGVAEPPNIPIDEGRSDTYRSLAKSGESRDGIVDKNDLKDPVMQACLFLWGRRRIEEEASTNFPIHTPQGHPYWISPLRLSLSRHVYNRDELKQATLLKDRGTGSTLGYQGTDPRYGTRVQGMVRSCTNKDF